MSLPAFAVRRPVAVGMFLLATVLLGTVSLLRMPVSLLPEVAYPRLVVWTAAPGLAPAEVERHVTEPVEAALSAVPGILALESVSSDGVSTVSVRLAWGTDMEFARLHVRERLDHLAGSLPQVAARPTILRTDPGSQPIVIAGVSTTGIDTGRGRGWRPPTLHETERLAETVFRRRLEQLDGVGRVSVVGGAGREIRVEVDPVRLEAHGLSLEEVAAAVEAANAAAPGGTVRRGRQRYALRALGELGSLEDIERVVAVRGKGGGTVRVADLARVADTVPDRDQAVYLDGRPSIGLVIHKESGANTVAAARQVERSFAELERRHPGIEITTVSSQAGFITAAIGNVVWALVLGGLLACLVLVPFLGDPRWPGVLALAIPIPIAAAFLLLDSTGVALDIMSLGGLALGIGMLVDGSIVVLENVFRHREEGAGAEVAAVRGAEEVQGAIVASTLTTIAVFGPIVFVEGLAGALFRELALAVAFTLLASVVVALTAVPVLAARLGAKGVRRPERAPVGRGRAAFERGFGRVERSYGRLLTLALDHPRRVFQWTGGALAVTAVMGLSLSRAVLPEVDQRSFAVRIALPPGTPLEATETQVFELDRWLRAQPEVETVQARAGRASAAEAVGPLGSGPVESGPNTAVLDVRLGGDGAPTRMVMERLRVAFAHLPPGALALETGRATELGMLLGTSEADLAVEVRGSDLKDLGKGARAVAGRLARLPLLADVGSEVRDGHPEAQVSIDREAVARHGLDVRTVMAALADRTSGRLATRLVDFDRRVPVVVRPAREEERDLERITAGTVQGVPLRLLLRVGQTTGPAAIHRAGQERIARVTADLAEGDLGGAIGAVREALHGLDLPDGVRLRVSGGARELGRSFRGLGLAFLLALLLVYMVLAAQFESLVLPVVVMLSVPLALIGAVGLLALTGNGLDTLSLIGIVVLAGIAVNNAIVMVDFILMARARGAPLRPAIEAAGRARLRPIVMTSSTTILGLLPMAAGLGSGAELRAPLAIAVIGGMVTSTALVLVVVPTFYQWAAMRRP